VVRGGRHLLTTQLYLLDHPQNRLDFLFRRLSPNEQSSVAMAITRRAASSRPTYDAEIDLVIVG
jgi:protocatechuate 3,4-dioxygenase beta subunit